MHPDQPLAELPDEVTFTLAEAARILEVVDGAVDRARPGSTEYRGCRAVQRLITGRLWPGLAELWQHEEDEEDEDG